MANVIKTVYTYPLDGTTTDFTINFEYLARKFVVITLIGVDRKELVVVTDYRFATRTTVSMTRAWGPADGYQQVEIRRYTSATERLVDFSDGSILRAMDLNVAQVQTLHVAEEARDLTADTIGVNNDGNLDARGRRIVNVANGIDPGDVVTVGQMDSWSGSAADSANKAKVSEDNAKTSETNSKTSETNAKTSEANSKASETLASKWAANPENAIVLDTRYSSLHYSRKASASATSSANSATAASNSAGAALASEQNAQGSAGAAKTEADKLIQFNTLVDRINSVAVAQVGTFELHNSRTYAKPGTAYGDGQISQRSLYPALVAELLAGNLPVVTDTVWLNTPSKRGCFSLGDGTTTFRFPDLNGVYAGSIKAPVFKGDGGGLTIGDVQESGVPNAKGMTDGYSLLGSIVPGNIQAANNISPTNPLNITRGVYSNRFGPSEGDSSWGSNIDLDLSRAHKVYRNGLDEVRVNGIVIVWVVRTHGVVNNPGSVDAAVLASRVEQVYTELLTRMVANENRDKSGLKFTRRVFSNITANGQLAVGQTVTCTESILNKMLTIGSHSVNPVTNPNSQIYHCSAFIQPNTADRMHLVLANWVYTLEFPAANQVKLVAASGNGVQAINYIDVICDYPQT